MEFLLIDVDSIHSSISYSSFQNKEIKIEALADAILESEGLLNPLVLKKVGFDSYEVVNGHLEYYAAVKASEKDPSRGEMVGAFIIEDEKANALKTQIEILRNPQIIQPEPENNKEQKFLNMESRLTNIESRLETRMSELKQDYQSQISYLENQLTDIQKCLPQPIAPLKALNTFTLTNLTSRLSRVNVKGAIIEKIISERDNNGEYKSCIDVVNRVKGLGDKTMLKIIDYFSENAV